MLQLRSLRIALLVILICGLAAACASQQPRSVASGSSEPSGSSSATSAQGLSLATAATTVTYGEGKLVVSPPTSKAPVDPSLAEARISADPLISAVLARGIPVTFEYADYTNYGFGDVTPPSGSSSSESIKLRFQDTPAWVVIIRNLPAYLNPRLGGIAASSTKVSPTGSAGTLIGAFSPDATAFLFYNVV